MKHKYAWSDFEIETLKNQYGKIHLNELVKLIPKRTKGAIRAHAQRYNLYADRSITNRRLEFDNHLCFNEPNIINSYWAGFLGADGSIRDKVNTVSFCQKDLNVVENLKNFLRFNGKIIPPAKNKSAHSFTVTSKQIVQDLKTNFNLCERKSNILKPPNLTGNLALAYITGYLDGDGHISIRQDIRLKVKKYYLDYSILGTIDMCQWFRDFLGNRQRINKRNECKFLYKVCGTHSIAEEGLYKLHDIKELENIRLSRKWDKVTAWRHKENCERFYSN